jgi:hypothetical protein
VENRRSGLTTGGVEIFSQFPGALRNSARLARASAAPRFKLLGSLQTPTDAAIQFQKVLGSANGGRPEKSERSERAGGIRQIGFSAGP